MHGTVQSYDKYDLLENVNNAARINWEYLDKYKPTPLGAVATEKMFVARHLAETPKNTSAVRYTHYIGTLATNDNILESISYVKDVSNCYAAHALSNTWCSLSLSLFLEEEGCL